MNCNPTKTFSFKKYHSTVGQVSDNSRFVLKIGSNLNKEKIRKASVVKFQDKMRQRTLILNIITSRYLQGAKKSSYVRHFAAADFVILIIITKKIQIKIFLKVEKFYNEILKFWDACNIVFWIWNLGYIWNNFCFTKRKIVKKFIHFNFMNLENLMRNCKVILIYIYSNIHIQENTW